MQNCFLLLRLPEKRKSVAMSRVMCFVQKYAAGVGEPQIRPQCPYVVLMLADIGVNALLRLVQSTNTLQCGTFHAILDCCAILQV